MEDSGKKLQGQKSAAVDASNRGRAATSASSAKDGKRNKKNYLIAVVFFVILAAIFCAVWFLISSREQKTTEQIKEEVDSLVLDVIENAGKKDHETIEKARNMYFEKIGATKGEEKFYYILAYVEFAANRQIGFLECEQYLKDAEELIETDQQRADYEKTRCFVLGSYGSEKFYTECKSEEVEDE